MIMAIFDGFISFCDFVKDSPAKAHAQVIFTEYLWNESLCTFTWWKTKPLLLDSFFEGHYKDKERHQKLASDGGSSSIVPHPGDSRLFWDKWLQTLLMASNVYQGEEASSPIRPLVLPSWLSSSAWFNRISSTWNLLLWRIKTVCTCVCKCSTFVTLFHFCFTL